MSPILFFNEITPEQLSLVGGKGRNLGRLATAGLPVPAGFVLTTEASAIAPRVTPKALCGRRISGWAAAWSRSAPPRRRRTFRRPASRGSRRRS